MLHRPVEPTQFTSDRFTSILLDAGVKVSMDGRRAWRDNVFIERFWWTLKHEEVYLRAYESVWEARTRIGLFMNKYNSRRRHSSLDSQRWSPIVGQPRKV